MRFLATLTLSVGVLSAQFKSTVPLVVAPTTVDDARGHFVDGLTEQDLIVYDNNVPQAIQVSADGNPISLVVVIQASSSAAAILDKLRGSGVLFSSLLAADTGETALVSFSDKATVMQEFTSDSSRLTHALLNLRVQGDGVALLDGLSAAVHLLAARDATRRRIVLVIGERRDRSSKVKIPELLLEIQRQNTSIYWLSYSTFLAPFTNRPKRVWDRMSEEEKADPRRMQTGSKYPLPEEEASLPPDIAPGSLLSIFTELAHKSAVNVATLFPRTTGGRAFQFSKQNALESAIQAVAEEVHRQYIVSFQPLPDSTGQFHSIRAEVKGRPDLQVRTRTGYWGVE